MSRSSGRSLTISCARPPLAPVMTIVCILDLHFFQVLDHMDRLILLGRNQEKLEQLYADHPQAECIGIDITDSSSVQKLVQELYQRYGRLMSWSTMQAMGSLKSLTRLPMSRSMPCLRSTPLPSCSFTLDGCAHEGSRQGAHRQHRQHGGSRRNSQIQPFIQLLSLRPLASPMPCG